MAAEKSRELSSETLFPSSWLSSAKLAGKDGKELGTCVDAMLGCSSGQLSYVVVAQGGIGGVGETFRRLDWRDIRVQEGSIRTALNERDFERLPGLAGDDWPGR